MTTTTTEFADKVADKFMTSDAIVGGFGSSRPSVWRSSLGQALRAALREAEESGKTINDLAEATPSDVADLIIPRVQHHERSTSGEEWSPVREKQEAIAQRLIDLAREIVGPNVGNDRNLRSVSPVVDRPEGVTGANDDRLTAWVTDGEADLYPTVDEQNTYLAKMGVLATPYTTGPGKDYLGMWMDHKRYHLSPAVRPFEVGTEWLVNGQEGGGSFLGPDGTRVVVVSRDHAEGGNDSLSTFGPIKVVPVDNPRQRWTRRFPSQLMPVGSAVAEEPAEATPEPSEIQVLQRQVADLRQQVSDRDRKWAREMHAVFDALKDEAERRDWCSEYEEFLDTVDGKVSIDLSDYRRSRDYEVSWVESYTVNVRRSVTITASNAEVAEEEAREEYEGAFDDYELADAIRYNANCDKEFSDSDDWTVEDA